MSGFYLLTYSQFSNHIAGCEELVRLSTTTVPDTKEDVLREVRVKVLVWSGEYPPAYNRISFPMLRFPCKAGTILVFRVFRFTAATVFRLRVLRGMTLRIAVQSLRLGLRSCLTFMQEAQYYIVLYDMII